MHDREMSIDEESKRLDTLRRYDILDTPRDERFDNITALTAELMQVPLALVTLVDADRLWFKSAYGLDASEIPRCNGLCSSAIQQDGPYIVEDALESPVEREHPLVTGPLGLRFYAGVPLRADDGRALGVLCIADRRPRQLAARAIGQLQALARMVMDQFELVRALRRVTSIAEDDRRFRLLFDRFLSAERNEPPDIDIDFEHERREEVIQYVYRKYSRDRAALAATLICYRSRSAIRDVCKAFGYSEDTIASLSKTQQWWSKGVTHEDMQSLGLNPDDRKLAMCIRLSQELKGFPRHLSQHVGGFVLARGRLDELAPIGNAAMPDRTFIEWDKDDIDALQLMKVDVLALGMLTCIRKARDLLYRHGEPRYGLRDFPPEDPAVYDMLCKGDSIGVFQVESRAQLGDAVEGGAVADVLVGVDGRVALLALDDLQIGEPLARLRFLMLEGLDREGYLEVGNVADEVEAGRIAAAGASADEYAPLTGEIGHCGCSYGGSECQP